jgi:hypothetical protein
MVSVGLLMKMRTTWRGVMMKRGKLEIVGELKNARMWRIDEFGLALEKFICCFYDQCWNDVRNFCSTISSEQINRTARPSLLFDLLPYWRSK